MKVYFLIMNSKRCTAIFYEIPTDQLIEVLKNLIARVVKSNAIC